MPTILITGAAGFIGSHLVDYFAQRGDRVICVDNFSTGRRRNLAHHRDNAAVEVVYADIRELAPLRALMRTHAPSAVLHHAAVVSVVASVADPLETDAVNTRGTLNVLLAARAAGVERVVLASSAAVYGDAAVTANRERDRPEPLSPYAASKLAGEHYCSVFNAVYGVTTVCLRYFNVYGPRQDPSSAYAAVVPKFVDRLCRGERVTIFGDGGQTRDFVFVGDVVRANALALAQPAPRAGGRVFNIATGTRTSILELAATLNTLLDQDLEPVFKPARTGEVRDSKADITLAGDRLDYEPVFTMTDGLRALLDAQQDPGRTGRLQLHLRS